MNPSQQPQNQPSNAPMFSAPFNSPVVSSPVTPPAAPESPPPTSKLVLIIGAVAALELLLVIGLGIALISSSGSKANDKTNAANSALSQDPQPATATGVQQTDDAISQDISSLNDDHDFPNGQIDDKTLGL